MNDMVDVARGSEGSTPLQTAHHVRYVDRSWDMWRWSILRGTGFPLSLTTRMGDPACLSRAKEATKAQQMAQTIRHQLVQQWGQPGQEHAAAVKSALRALRAGALPDGATLPSAMASALDPLVQAQGVADAHAAAFAQAYAAAVQAAEGHLREAVGSEPFRQAIVWQNRRLLREGIDYYLGKPPTTTGRDYLRNRATLLKYLQRYTMKNDTIGFFGPVGWLWWDVTLPQTRFAPGKRLIAHRTTYIEGWGINALSAAIAAEPDVLPWATPRLAPQFAVVGTTLHFPFGKPVSLSLAQAAVLQACTGASNAHDIAQRLMQAGIPGLGSESAVYDLLAQMQRTRRITWSFDVTLETPFPERALRQQLSRIEPATRRAAALGKLDALESAVHAVRDAAEHSAALNRALAQVETTFTELTGSEATRSAGQMYAGRTLVYEDCARDMKLELGPEVLRALEPPLTLLLTAARWLTGQLAEACRGYLRTAYAELAQKRGGNFVEFAEFFPWVNTHLEELSDSIFGPAQRAFQAKWAALLGPMEGQRDVHFRVADLAPHVAAAFAAPGPAWAAARYYSPDIMIAARDAAAIAQNDCTFVLGELHQCTNTLGVQLFTQQHPRISDFYAALAADVPEPQVIPLAPSHLLPATRSQHSTVLPKDFRLITSTDICDGPVDQHLRLGDLVVELVGDTLRTRTRDGHHAFDTLDVISDYLARLIVDLFEIVPKGAHTPRISIDQLVVTREAWQIPVGELAAIVAPDAATSYMQAVAWADAHGMPQHLFYRTPTERKPGFLDLANPLSVDLFTREVRRVAQTDAPADAAVSISEMLPRPDQVWLTDGQGNHYASELRLALVDRKDRL